MKSREKALVVPLPVVKRTDGARIGRIVAFEAGEVRVDYDGNLSGPLVARVSAALDDSSLMQAARQQRETLLLFEEGEPRKPVVVALLRSRTPLVDALLTSTPPQPQKVARIDGKRVAIEGSEEVVLMCGEATLTLRRDGRIILKGVNIVSRASQVQRIRGGTVQIN